MLLSKFQYNKKGWQEHYYCTEYNIFKGIKTNSPNIKLSDFFSNGKNFKYRAVETIKETGYIHKYLVETPDTPHGEYDIDHVVIYLHGDEGYSSHSKQGWIDTVNSSNLAKPQHAMFRVKS